MGIHGRPYMQDGRFAVRGRVVLWLVGITVAAFFAQGMARGRGGFDLAPFLGVVPEKLVFHGWLWQLVTHAFLHSPQNVWHIALNMLALFWLGTDVAELYGTRRFLFLYFGGAVMCAVVYTIVAFIDGRPNAVAIGASGAVFAVSVVAAFLFPTRTIYLFWFIPAPLWVVVALYVAMDAYHVVTGITTGVASAGHLGGALFGLLVHKLGLDGSAGARVWGWLAGAFRRRERRVESRSNPEVDRILGKISAEGIGSLTDEERATLKKAAE